MKTLIITGLTALSLAACLNSNAAPNQNSPDLSQPTQSVSMADFNLVAGTGWSGTLSYLDYTKQTRETIPVEFLIDEPKDRSITYAIKFPGEAKYNSREKIKLSRNGEHLNGDRVTKRVELAGGGLKIVTEKTGKDDNRPATIRTSYILTTDTFKIQKDVKFSDGTDYFNRNEFSLTR